MTMSVLIYVHASLHKMVYSAPVYTVKMQCGISQLSVNMSICRKVKRNLLRGIETGGAFILSRFSLDFKVSH